MPGSARAAAGSVVRADPRGKALLGRLSPCAPRTAGRGLRGRSLPRPLLGRWLRGRLLGRAYLRCSPRLCCRPRRSSRRRTIGRRYRAGHALPAAPLVSGSFFLCDLDGAREILAAGRGRGGAVGPQMPFARCARRPEERTDPIRHCTPVYRAGRRREAARSPNGTAVLMAAAIRLRRRRDRAAIRAAVGAERGDTARYLAAGMIGKPTTRAGATPLCKPPVPASSPGVGSAALVDQARPAVRIARWSSAPSPRRARSSTAAARTASWSAWRARNCPRSTAIS